MKNFKKLLVTLLALVLLICGATVVSLAADTPAEIIAEAQILLDQAAAEDGYIAVRSQKMRELDKLIDSNYSTIKNSQEWREFQIGYRAAQEQLKEDSVAEATASLDRLLDKEISAAEASALYSGLSQLIALSGDSRGYFDTSSEAYAALTVRMKVAETIARLQTAEDTVVAKDKGASLLWVYEYRAMYLDEDAAVTATEDYALMKAWFDELYASISERLFEEIIALTDEACLSKTTFARGIALADEIDSYFNSCYFNTSVPEYANATMYSKYARVYVYLNEIERSSVLVTQGTHLKTLVALRDAIVLNDQLDRYADFTARYNALLDTTDASSVASRLCALADGYKKDVSDVFADGYTGPLKDTAAIQAVVDELDALVATCYFPAASTYANDLYVAMAYARIYDFYVVMKTMDTAADAFITRNKLYKAALDSYASLTAGVLNADMAYRDPFLALYNGMTSQANAEINAILNGWLSAAQQADIKDDGEYRLSLDDVVEAYNNLQTYYIAKETALYFRATEDKTMTARIKTACQKVEERLMQTLTEELFAAKNLILIPENLAEVDLVGLAARKAKLDELLQRTAGLTLSYMDAKALPLFRHELIVAKMLTLLCYVEIEYAKGPDGEAASVAFYNELKTFAADHLTEVDTAAEDYIAYLAYLNKTEVKMGNANVPGARSYLDALAAVVDADNFDKVYALMHLNEYIRQNVITRPDASDTTSASALFYKEYDELVGKVKAWRKAKVDEREAKVPISDYSLTGINQWNMEDRQLTSALASNKFTAEDKRYGGAGGSETCATFEYLQGGGDGYMIASLPSSTANIIFEMDLTTFTNWPASGVSFNSGTYGLTEGKRIYPWLGAITGAGQLQVPNGPSSSNRKVITDREGGYIIPGQWTHFVIVYNAAEKLVSYYINDEKIVAADGTDAWSCALSDSFNFSEALRIGHSQGGAASGSFSVDNLQIYVGDQPRDINLFANMSSQQRFAYYTNYAKKYIDTAGESGSAATAKLCYDEAMALHSLYWGTPEGGTEATYLFDETTYWDPTAVGYVDIGLTYAELKQAVDDYRIVAAQADSVIDNAMVEECFNEVKTMVEKLETLSGIANLTARQTLLDTLNTYIETNVSYLARLDEAKAAIYEQLLVRRDAVVKEIEAYSRANEYIVMVNKLAAARDLYSRTVYRAQAQEMMKSMETDSSLGYFDLEMIKADVAEFAAAIELFDAQSKLLDDQLLRDNNEIIIDCMSRFPATPEEAMKNYSYLNKYIVLARSIILEGSYDAKDARVQEALAIYEKMDVLFYDALQKDHAATLQALIDQFNIETAYITRLGIYNATKSYLEQNAATIDQTHDAIKGIYSQYEIMEAQFGSEEGREEEWEKYGETLQANTLKFVNIVMQMRFSKSYNELLSLREQAAAVYYYMDSTTADAQLAVEYYHTYEKLLTYKALCGDAFIDAAYALKKAKTMQQTYLALLAAKAAYELADTTYAGSLTYTETAGENTYTVTFSMQEAVETYTIALSQYNSFVTVINGEVNVVLDIVCAVRANFSVNQPIVALFKKFYD